jgi:ABC-type multidrug transport system fused ATPase/permease subunit
LKDAPILILDEPTANLDVLTEREIMAELQSLMAGRTTIMITHRLVGLESVDEILVLKAGRVVERGTFPDLMQLGGEFRQMFDLQQQALALT